MIALNSFLFLLLNCYYTTSVSEFSRHTYAGSPRVFKVFKSLLKYEVHERSLKVFENKDIMPQFMLRSLKKFHALQMSLKVFKFSNLACNNISKYCW